MKNLILLSAILFSFNAFSMEEGNKPKSAIAAPSEYSLLILPRDILSSIIKLCILQDVKLEDSIEIIKQVLPKNIKNLSRINKLFKELTNSDLMAKYILQHFEEIKQTYFAKWNLKYELTPGKIDPNQLKLLKKTNLQKRLQDFHAVKLPLSIESQESKDNALKYSGKCRDLIILLVCNGANVNAPACKDWPVIIDSILECNEEIVEFLIKKGAYINQPEKYTNETPLSCAARNGYKNIVAMLLKAGADPKLSNWQAVQNSEYKNHDKVLDLLISSIKDFDAKDSEEKTLLMRASQNGHKKIVQNLIEKGVNVNATNKWGRNALMEASGYGHSEIVKMLLKAGADVNAKQDDGSTALITAADNRWVERDNIVPILVENGADILAQDKFGRTALRGAVQSENINNVKLLIEKGAVIDDQDGSGWTPLMLAAHCGHKEAVELLLNKGVDVHTKETEKGRTALDIAQDSINNAREFATTWNIPKGEKISALYQIIMLLKKEMIKNNSNNNANESIDEKEFVCPICMDKIEDEKQIVKTSCSHKFCQNCLDIWAKQKSFYQKESSESEDLVPTCPLCREKL